MPSRLPDRAEMPERLDAALEAIYAAFTEGWSDPAGTEPPPTELAQEALWLGRLVARLLPGEPEVLGLLALMLHLEARRGARRDHQGGYIPLDEQDPSKWDAMLISEAEDILLGASRWGASAATSSKAPCNPPMRSGGSAGLRLDGAGNLYDALLVITGPPVVAINRAMVVAEAEGPKEGLAILCDVESDPRLSQYQPYWAARAELLARCGQAAAADQAYACAIRLEPDPSVRRFLQAQRERLPTASAIQTRAQKLIFPRRTDCVPLSRSLTHFPRYGRPSHLDPLRVQDFARTSCAGLMRRSIGVSDENIRIFPFPISAALREKASRAATCSRSPAARSGGSSIP